MNKTNRAYNLVLLLYPLLSNLTLVKYSSSNKEEKYQYMGTQSGNNANVASYVCLWKTRLDHRQSVEFRWTLITIIVSILSIFWAEILFQQQLTSLQRLSSGWGDLLHKQILSIWCVLNMIDLIPCVLTAFIILFFVCSTSVGLAVLLMLF